MQAANARQAQPGDYSDLPADLVFFGLSPLLAPSPDLLDFVSVEDLAEELEPLLESPEDFLAPDGLSLAAALL